MNATYVILTSTEKQTLHKHIASIHKGEKPFKISIMRCQICIEIAFENNSLKIHEKKKPYECAFCNINFGQKSILSTHISTVLEEEKLKCSQCRAL